MAEMQLLLLPEAESSRALNKYFKEPSVAPLLKEKEEAPLTFCNEMPNEP